MTNKQIKNQESKLHTSHENRTDSTVCALLGCMFRVSLKQYSPDRRKTHSLRILKYCIMPQSNVFGKNQNK